MSEMKRRSFLAKSSLGAAAVAMPAISASGASSANETVVLATIGCGGRGSRLTRNFSDREDCKIAAVCDVDRGRSGRLSDQIGSSSGKKPTPFTNYRRVLDDKDVDGIVVGTPDHWHGLLTVFGCQAGKDVYVEKPASHNIFEGQQMVAASRKYKRVVQVGTQNRSAPYCLKALELIRGGGLGKIHLCKVYNLKSGGPYRRRPVAPLPAGVDYDAWLGPAPAAKFDPSRFHGGWYFWWDFCGGDFGNDSIHQLDIARWFIDKAHPKSVHCTGGNFAFEDDREVPDTQVATFEYDDMLLTFELTQWSPYMKKTNNQTRTGDTFPLWNQNATRIELYGSKRLMVLGRHGGGWQVFTNDGKVVEQSFGRFPDPPHQQNFVDCIRSRKTPNADILEGHRSAILFQIGNISYRLGGKKLSFDAKTERFVGAEDANGMLRRDFRKSYEMPESV